MGSTCITTTASSDAAEPQLSVIDVTNGAVQVEAAGIEPVVADASGCIVGASTSVGYDVMSSDGVQELQTDDMLFTISLDGLSVVVQQGARLVLLGSGVDGPAPDDPIDLGPQGRTVFFTQS